jgi:hypothetical protein
MREALRHDLSRSALAAYKRTLAARPFPSFCQRLPVHFNDVHGKIDDRRITDGSADTITLHDGIQNRDVFFIDTAIPLLTKNLT